MSNSGRRVSCTPGEGRARLEQASAFLFWAQQVVENNDLQRYANVAVSLAVDSGIASGDAACCLANGVMARGQDHQQAVPLLKSVRPDGPAMAKDLSRLLQLKSGAAYGGSLLSPQKARDAVAWSGRLWSLANKLY